MVSATAILRVLVAAVAAVAVIYGQEPRAKQGQERSWLLVRAFEKEIGLDPKRTYVVINGEPSLDFNVRTGLSVRDKMLVQDRYTDIPFYLSTSFFREFVEIEGQWATSLTNGEGVRTYSRESHLEARRVSFEDVGMEGVAVSFVEDSSETDLLAGLEPDMDFHGLIGQLESGSRRDLEPEAILRLLHPGGIRLQATGMPAPEATRVEPVVLGGISVEYQGIYDDEGIEVEVLVLSASVTVSNDDVFPLQDGQNSISSTYDLDGELVWNKELGFLQSLDLQGTIEVRVEMDSGFPEFDMLVYGEGDVKVSMRADVER